MNKLYKRIISSLLILSLHNSSAVWACGSSFLGPSTNLRLIDRRAKALMIGSTAAARLRSLGIEEMKGLYRNIREGRLDFEDIRQGDIRCIILSDEDDSNKRATYVFDDKTGYFSRITNFRNVNELLWDILELADREPVETIDINGERQDLYCLEKEDVPPIKLIFNSLYDREFNPKVYPREWNSPTLPPRSLPTRRGVIGAFLRLLILVTLGLAAGCKSRKEPPSDPKETVERHLQQIVDRMSNKTEKQRELQGLAQLAVDKFKESGKLISGQDIVIALYVPETGIFEVNYPMLELYSDGFVQSILVHEGQHVEDHSSYNEQFEKYSFVGRLIQENFSWIGRADLLESEMDIKGTSVKLYKVILFFVYWQIFLEQRGFSREYESLRDRYGDLNDYVDLYEVDTDIERFAIEMRSAAKEGRTGDWVRDNKDRVDIDKIRKYNDFRMLKVFLGNNGIFGKSFTRDSRPAINLDGALDPVLLRRNIFRKYADWGTRVPIYKFFWNIVLSIELRLGNLHAPKHGELRGFDINNTTDGFLKWLETGRVGDEDITDIDFPLREPGNTDPGTTNYGLFPPLLIGLQSLDTLPSFFNYSLLILAVIFSLYRVNIKKVLVNIYFYIKSFPASILIFLILTGCPDVPQFSGVEEDTSEEDIDLGGISGVDEDTPEEDTPEEDINLDDISSLELISFLELYQPGVIEPLSTDRLLVIAGFADKRLYLIDTKTMTILASSDTLPEPDDGWLSGYSVLTTYNDGKSALLGRSICGLYYTEGEQLCAVIKADFDEDIPITTYYEFTAGMVTDEKLEFITGLTASPDGRFLYVLWHTSAGYKILKLEVDGDLDIYNPAASYDLPTEREGDQQLTWRHIRVSSDGKRIFAIEYNEYIIALDAETLQPLGIEIEGQGDSLFVTTSHTVSNTWVTVKNDPDKLILAVWYQDTAPHYRIDIINTPEGITEWSFPLPFDFYTIFGIDQRGRYGLFGGGSTLVNDELSLVDFDTGEVKYTLQVDIGEDDTPSVTGGSITDNPNEDPNCPLVGYVAADQWFVAQIGLCTSPPDEPAPSITALKLKEQRGWLNTIKLIFLSNAIVFQEIFHLLTALIFLPFKWVKIKRVDLLSAIQIDYAGAPPRHRNTIEQAVRLSGPLANLALGLVLLYTLGFPSFTLAGISSGYLIFSNIFLFLSDLWLSQKDERGDFAKVWEAARPGERMDKLLGLYNDIKRVIKRYKKKMRPRTGEDRLTTEFMDLLGKVQLGPQDSLFIDALTFNEIVVKDVNGDNKQVIEGYSHLLSYLEEKGVDIVISGDAAGILRKNLYRFLQTIEEVSGKGELTTTDLLGFGIASRLNVIVKDKKIIIGKEIKNRRIRNLLSTEDKQMDGIIEEAGASGARYGCKVDIDTLTQEQIAEIRRLEDVVWFYYYSTSGRDTREFAREYNLGYHSLDEFNANIPNEKTITLYSISKVDRIKKDGALMSRYYLPVIPYRAHNIRMALGVVISNADKATLEKYGIWQDIHNIICELKGADIDTDQLNQLFHDPAALYTILPNIKSLIGDLDNLAVSIKLSQISA